MIAVSFAKCGWQRVFHSQICMHIYIMIMPSPHTQHHHHHLRPQPTKIPKQLPCGGAEYCGHNRQPSTNHCAKIRIGRGGRTEKTGDGVMLMATSDFSATQIPPLSLDTVQRRNSSSPFSFPLTYCFSFYGPLCSFNCKQSTAQCVR